MGVEAAARSILVVDDSPTSLRTVSQALVAQGFNVTTATDGEEALAIAARDEFDVILLDILLPKRNGFQVCRQLKTDPATKHVKVILVSGKSLDSDKQWGLMQGADGYVTKPFDMEELIDAIDQTLKAPEEHGETNCLPKPVRTPMLPGSALPA